MSFFLAAIGAGVVACNGSGTAATNYPMLPATPVQDHSLPSPISHVIVIIQENRSFDDFFATFPGANGTTTGLAEAMPPAIASACANASPPQKVIASPTSIPLTRVTLKGDGFPGNFDHFSDLAHNHPRGYLVECDSAARLPSSSNPCRMDGFDVIGSGPDGDGPPMCTYPYQYVAPADIEPYWTMAKQYVLADNAFQTQGSESFTAHQALIAGGTKIDSTASLIDDPTWFPWGCDGHKGSEKTSLLTIHGEYERDKGPFPCLTYPTGTIRDLLDAKQISWKFYAMPVYSYKIYQKGEERPGGAGIWSAFDAIKAVRYSKEWGTKVVWPDTKIFNDIVKGRLPVVAWLTPDAKNSDHAQEPSDTGPSWVAQVVNAIGTSKYWKSSAIVVLWDDWGGYYDHVPPPKYDHHGGLGFRFPMIVISPYVRPHVEHTQYETASVLRFIEDNWNLATLGQQDEWATGIENAFDFKQSPRPFHRIKAKYSQAYFLRQQASGESPDTE